MKISMYILLDLDGCSSRLKKKYFYKIDTNIFSHNEENI